MAQQMMPMSCHVHGLGFVLLSYIAKLVFTDFMMAFEE